jgi:hypothetical protein
MPRQPKPPRRRTVIYGLVDPRDGLIYYVGKTTNPSRRVEGHLKETVNKNRVAWIKDLVAHKLLPILIILETVPKDKTWEDTEIYWIAKGRALGWPLLNVSDGGNEPPRYTNVPTRGTRRGY